MQFCFFAPRQNLAHLDHAESGLKVSMKNSKNFIPTASCPFKIIYAPWEIRHILSPRKTRLRKPVVDHAGFSF